MSYASERYGSNKNRHWWGISHRQLLLSRGEYIRTTERDQDRALRRVVGEPGPELIQMKAGN